MEFTATVLHCICSILVLATWRIQAESLALADNIVCENSPYFLTNSQMQECKKYPELVKVLLSTTEVVFSQQCQHHFKHEKWNCQDISPPIFGVTQSFSTLQTKEAAFVHALASAAVVHAVAGKCARNQLPYCGCDKSLNDEDLPPGERWAGCSPDVDFSINFAKSFVDRRVDSATLQYQKFVLHNNRIGQLAIRDYMYKTCVCVGSGVKQCSQRKLCRMELPTMNEVAEALKKKYDQSSYAMIIPSSSPQQVLVVERDNFQVVNTEKMIYFVPSPNYCKFDPSYNIAGTAERECTLDDTSFSGHCDNLCCGHGYETFTVTVPKNCNCKFVWCCHVQCETCYKTETRHRCRDQSDVDVSSTTDVEVSSTSGDWIVPILQAN